MSLHWTRTFRISVEINSLLEASERMRATKSVSLDLAGRVTKKVYDESRRIFAGGSGQCPTPDGNFVMREKQNLNLEP